MRPTYTVTANGYQVFHGSDIDVMHTVLAAHRLAGERCVVETMLTGHVPLASIQEDAYDVVIAGIEQDREFAAELAAFKAIN